MSVYAVSHCLGCGQTRNTGAKWRRWCLDCRGKRPAVFEKSLLARILASSQLGANGCMEWTGACLRRSGYGRLTINGRKYLVHRVVWELTKGPIPVGLELDHLCHNTACFNVDHLEPVTHAVNASRERRNPYCRSGRHLMSEHGLPSHSCGACVRENQARPHMCADCGVTVTFGSRLRHEQSARHQRGAMRGRAA